MKRIVAVSAHILFLLGSVVGFPLLAIAPVFAANHTFYIVADAKSDACAGIGLAGGNCSGAGSQTQANSILTTAVNFFAIAVGVAAVVMIIVAGMKYVSSGGDSQKVAGAKTTLIYAIVGLIVAAAAMTIVKLVLGNV